MSRLALAGLEPTILWLGVRRANHSAIATRHQMSHTPNTRHYTIQGTSSLWTISISRKLRCTVEYRMYYVSTELLVCRTRWNALLLCCLLLNRAPTNEFPRWSGSNSGPIEFIYLFMYLFILSIYLFTYLLIYRIFVTLLNTAPFGSKHFNATPHPFTKRFRITSNPLWIYLSTVTKRIVLDFLIFLNFNESLKHYYDGCPILHPSVLVQLFMR